MLNNVNPGIANNLGFIGPFWDLFKVAGFAGRMLNATPYLVGGVAVGLAGKFLVPEDQKGIKIATTIGALGLVGIGVWKIIKE